MRTTRCRSCGDRLDCNCCGLAPHEPFCQTRGDTCENCAQEQAADPTFELRHLIEPADADAPDELADHVADLSIEEIDALLRKQNAA